MEKNPPKDSPKDSRDSREKLMAAAKRVFAKQGYEGATVKELADEAGVNISLVSYYFGGKEGLFKACIEEAGRNRIAIAERVLKAPQSLEDFRVRLTLFIEEFFNYNLSDMDMCTILHQECMSAGSSASEAFADTFLKAHEKALGFFKSAQDTGIIRKEVDVQVMNYLFFGALVSAVRFEPISKEFFGKSLEDRNFRDVVIKHAVDYLVGGFIETGKKSASRD